VRRRGRAKPRAQLRPAAAARASLCVALPAAAAAARAHARHARVFFWPPPAACSNFGSYVTHETKHFIYFYLGQVAILCFKSG
jgi:hypothetical protein